MDMNEAWGVALREARNSKKLSQEALAYEAGLNRTFISLLELGKRSPTLSTMVSLGEALSLPPSQLLLAAEAIFQRHDTDEKPDGTQGA